MKLFCALAAYRLGSNENRLYCPTVTDNQLQLAGRVCVYASVEIAKSS